MEDMEIVTCTSSPKWIADQRSAGKQPSEIGDNSTTDWRLQKGSYLPTSFDVSEQLQLKIAMFVTIRIDCFYFVAFFLFYYTPWGPSHKTLKMQIGPPYRHARRKRQLKWRFLGITIKREVTCRWLDGHIKEPKEISMAWEPDRKFNFLFRLPAQLHVCAVTYIT